MKLSLWFSVILIFLFSSFAVFSDHPSEDVLNEWAISAAVSECTNILQEGDSGTYSNAAGEYDVSVGDIDEDADDVSFNVNDEEFTMSTHNSYLLENGVEFYTFYSNRDMGIKFGFDCSGTGVPEIGEIVCCQGSLEKGYSGFGYNWVPEDSCEESGKVVSSDNCGNDLIEFSGGREGNKLFSCKGRDDCLELCKNMPACEYERESEDGGYKEKFVIKTDNGEFKYEFNTFSKAGTILDGDLLDVEYKTKDYYHFDGIKPESIIMNKMFEGLEHSQFDECLQSCPNTEAVTACTLDKLNEFGKGDLGVTCDGLENQFNTCKEKSLDNCENILDNIWFKHKDLEIKCSDDIDKEDLYDYCVEKSSGTSSDPKEACEKRWKENEKVCEASIERCEEFEEKKRKQNEMGREHCDRIRETGDFTDEDYKKCLESFGRAEEAVCNLSPGCDEKGFIEKCELDEGFSREGLEYTVGEECLDITSNLLKQFEQDCSGKKSAYTQCLISTNKKCDVIENSLEQCNSATNDNARELMLKHSAKMCKFSEHRDDYELINKMFEKRDQLKDKSELQLVLDKGAEDFVELKEDIDVMENKPFGYKIKKFLCMQEENELAEANKISELTTRIKDKVDIFKALSDTIENEDTKLALVEISIDLGKEADLLDNMVENKRKRARGLCSLF